MPHLVIDGQPVETAAGETILDAARKLGIEIPTLCFREGCRADTSCLVCVVRVNGSAHLVPSCATEAQDGMVVESETEEVRAARRTGLELLLGDHRGDCVGPCQTVCPAHMDIPRMIRLIAAGRMDEAVAVVRDRIPLPAILGRICPELCEKGCRRGDLDAPIAIRLLKRYVGDYALREGSRLQPVCAPPTGKRVAIIGAGPAGLSAAWYLALAGHRCTVLDERDLPGGMVRYGVAEELLPRETLDAEIRSVLALGIELRCGVRVGRDVSLADLRQRFDAVLLATGEVTGEEGEALGVALSGKGIRADPHTQMTEMPGVFVAGSALSPSRHAVRAVGSGRGAACSIDQFLSGRAAVGARRPYTVHMGRLREEELEAFTADAPRYGRLAPIGGEPAGFSGDEARAESDRCLRCNCAGIGKCKLRAWGEAYGASPTRYRDERRTFAREATHPAVVYEPGKCIDCGLCIQIAQRAGNRLGLTFVGRGFDVRVKVPFDEALAAGLELAARECAEACPTGALVLREEPRVQAEMPGRATGLPGKVEGDG